VKLPLSEVGQVTCNFGAKAIHSEARNLAVEGNEKKVFRKHQKKTTSQKTSTKPWKTRLILWS